MKPIEIGDIISAHPRIDYPLIVVAIDGDEITLMDKEFYTITCDKKFIVENVRAGIRHVAKGEIITSGGKRSKRGNWELTDKPEWKVMAFGIVSISEVYARRAEEMEQKRKDALTMPFPEHSTTAPNEYYCLVYEKVDKKRKNSLAFDDEEENNELKLRFLTEKFYNEQYIREREIIDESIDLYKFKLAGYHKDEYGDWGFEYVYVRTPGLGV